MLASPDTTRKWMLRGLNEALRDRESWNDCPEAGKEQQGPGPSAPAREMTIEGGGWSTEQPHQNTISKDS